MGNSHSTVAAEVPSWRSSAVGAEIGPDGAVHMRVWAPRRSSVAFVILSESGERMSATELETEGNGYFSGLIGGASAGTLYKLRLDDEKELPDPLSRFQPDGPHGPSRH